MSKSKIWNETALSPKCFACQRKTCCLFCQFPIDGCRKIVKQIQLSNTSNWIMGIEFINTHYTPLINNSSGEIAGPSTLLHARPLRLPDPPCALAPGAGSCIHGLHWRMQGWIVEALARAKIQPFRFEFRSKLENQYLNIPH